MKENKFQIERRKLLSILNNEREFFTRLYSAHYKFSPEQIIYYRDILFWGGGFYTWEESDPYLNSFTTPKVGLCFNHLIHWNSFLLKLAEFEIDGFQGTGFGPYEIPLNVETELRNRYDKFFYISLPENAPVEIKEDFIQQHLEKLSEVTNPNRVFKVHNIKALLNYIQGKEDIDLLQFNLFLSIKELLNKYNIDFIKDVLDIKEFQLNLIFHDANFSDTRRQNSFWYFGKKIAEYQIRYKRKKINYYIESEGKICVKFKSRSPYLINEDAVNEGLLLELDDRRLYDYKFKSRNWFTIYRKVGKQKIIFDVQMNLRNATES